MGLATVNTGRGLGASIHPMGVCSTTNTALLCCTTCRRVVSKELALVTPARKWDIWVYENLVDVTQHYQLWEVWGGKMEDISCGMGTWSDR